MPASREGRSLEGMSASERSAPRGEGFGLARIPVDGTETIRCRQCHSPAPENLLRIAGAWSVIHGVAMWDCDSCARARLHEYEAEGLHGSRVHAHA
jgi:hypothetical protein